MTSAAMGTVVDLDRPVFAPGLPSFARESAVIWSRCWVLAGVEGMIPEPGDVLPATVGDHGVHVRRREDGSLDAGYNAFQQGSCWTIPAQCGNGSKVACAYLSCGHSRDGGALRPGRGDDDRVIRQVVGARPDRRVPVRLARRGPLLLVAMPGVDPGPPEEQMPECVRGLDGSWEFHRPAGIHRLEMACNWREAGARVGAAVAERDGGRTAVRVDPPNAVVLDGPEHRTVLAVKPVNAGRCEVAVAVHVRDGAAPDTDGAGWRSLLADAARRPVPEACAVADWARARLRDEA